MKTFNFVKFIVFFLFLLFGLRNTTGFRCDRRPYGSQLPSSPPDGRYQLKLLEAEHDAYVPNQVYVVELAITDDESHFTGFMISAEGETKPDAHNPRKLIPLYPGEVRPSDPAVSKFSDRCPNSVEQAMGSTKSSAQVYWQAPSAGNGCVTLRAMVIESNELWFEDGDSLVLHTCEDLWRPDDVGEPEHVECSVCDEAKYEVSFTGIWSRNTHPRLFPENDWLPKLSDMVGASHSPELSPWSINSLASEGLKELAQYANTTKFEEEIREKIGDGVRTMIKGKGHGYRKMGLPMYSLFRADRENHLLTVAVAIHPSPDWFLGVAGFQLCQGDVWLAEKELNLYPWDAGTNSGISYESADMPTIPPEPVVRVEMSSYDQNSPFFEMDMRSMHPFGILRVTLIRTYHRECEETTESTTESEGTTEEGAENENPDSRPQEPEEPSRYQNPDIASGIRVGKQTSSTSTTEAPIVSDPKSSEACPMSQWSAWSRCEGACEGGRVRGYQWRERYHLVDGVAVEKYDPKARYSHRKEVSRYCKEHIDDFERSDCDKDCSEAPSREENAERRMGGGVPDYMLYYSRKRDLSATNN